MISYNEIKKLEGMDDQTVKEILELAKEAEEAEELIKTTWVFKEGEERIMFGNPNSDSPYQEELTSDRVWIRGYGDDYEAIAGNASGIFEFLLAEYMAKNNLPCANAETYKMAQICGYFRKFLERTQEKHDSATR